MPRRRLNVVDIAIVLLVLVAAGVYVAKRSARPPAPPRTMPVTLVFQSKPTANYTNDLTHLALGQPVSAVLTNGSIGLGTVAGFTVVPDPVEVQTASGGLRMVPDLRNRLLRLTIDARAAEAGGAYLFRNQTIYIGQEVMLLVGPIQVDGYILDIRPRHP